MSRGLGSTQREILVELAKNALDPRKPDAHDIQDAYVFQDAYDTQDEYEIEDAILLEGGDAIPAYWATLHTILSKQWGDWDLARSSSARRALRLLYERGLLEVTLLPALTDYVRAGESFGTERWTRYVRLPPLRFDPEVAELRGSVIAQHCRGIADVLATPRQLAWQEWRSDYVAHEPDPQLRERYFAGVRIAERAVAYHLQKLDRLPSISPIGWPHVYTRHVAHWAYEASAVAG
jgi:hypothetical protein